MDKLNFKRSCWEGISEEARDFVAQLLHKDPARRPSAKQALKHPWLKGSAAERSAGRPLSLKVVQRIQVGFLSTTANLQTQSLLEHGATEYAHVVRPECMLCLQNVTLLMFACRVASKEWQASNLL